MESKFKVLFSPFFLLFQVSGAKFSQAGKIFFSFPAAVYFLRLFR